MSRFTHGAAAVLALIVVAGCGGGGGDDDVPLDADGADATGDVADGTASGDDDASPPDTGAPDGGDDPAGDSPFDVASGPGEGAPGAPDPDDVPDGAGPDNGPEGQAPVGTGADTSAIAGFWDYTRDVPEGTDVAFFDIAGDGTVTEYDFRGDDAGDGRDCHTVFTASIASNGDGRYDIQDSSSLPGASSVDDVRIAAENGSIVFRYIGDAFDPEFGEGMAGVTETYPAAGASPTDLAICE